MLHATRTNACVLLLYMKAGNCMPSKSISQPGDVQHAQNMMALTIGMTLKTYERMHAAQRTCRRQ